MNLYNTIKKKPQKFDAKKNIDDQWQLYHEIYQS